MEFKGSKGEWFINYVSGIPIGVNAVIEEKEFGTFSKTVVETLLPDTDKEWAKEQKETTANLKLIAAAPDLLLALQEILSINDVPFRLTRNKELTINDIARKAIEKALK